jgi:hypothetical protein
MRTDHMRWGASRESNVTQLHHPTWGKGYINTFLSEM